MRRSPLLVIFITIFIDLIGFGIVIPVLPFYVESPRFSATPRDVGLLFASYSVMQFIFAPVLGRLSDKHGRRPVLLVSLVGTAVGCLILGFATSLWMLFVGRIVSGITGGNISTAQAYIADVTTPENRARGMGMIGAAFGLGFIFGPALGGVLSRWGIGVPFLFAAALSLANAVLLYFTLPETVTPEHPARVSAGAGRGWSALIDSLRQVRLAFVLVIYFLFIVSFSILFAAFALYTMYRFGLDAQQNGYLFAFIGIIAVVVQGGLIGRLVKSYGEVSLVIIAGVLCALTLFSVPLIGPQSGGLPLLLLVMGVFSVGNSLSVPALNSLASKSVGAGEQGGVLGVVNSVASLARAVGPIIQALLIESATAPGRMDDRSLRITFWTATAIMLAALVLTIRFARVRASDSPGEVIDAGY